MIKKLFFLFFTVPAFASPAVNVQYVHDTIRSVKGINVPINSSANSLAIANMEYLLAAIDAANHVLNGCAVTDYIYSDEISKYAADTTALNSAISTLIETHPCQYYAVEYLTFNRAKGSYINSQIPQSQTLKIEGKYALNSINTSWAELFGARASADSTANAFNMHARMDTARASVTASSAADTSSSVYINSIDTNPHTFSIDMPTGRFYYDDVHAGTLNITRYPSTKYKIYIGAINYGDQSSAAYFEGDMYYFKMYNSGVLVRDFIPVRRGRIYGMLDLVSKEFFRNSKPGQFTGGPDAGVRYDMSGNLM